MARSSELPMIEEPSLKVQRLGGQPMSLPCGAVRLVPVEHGVERDHEGVAVEIGLAGAVVGVGAAASAHVPEAVQDGDVQRDAEDRDALDAGVGARSSPRWRGPARCLGSRSPRWRCSCSLSQPFAELCDWSSSSTGSSVVSKRTWRASGAAVARGSRPPESSDALQQRGGLSEADFYAFGAIVVRAATQTEPRPRWARGCARRCGIAAHAPRMTGAGCSH